MSAYREDFSGWEYRETDQDRRKRFRIQQEFEKKIQSEVQRRTEKPNDLEQVEDTLFHIVDTICRKDAKQQWLVAQAKKKRERAVWHPVTK